MSREKGGPTDRMQRRWLCHHQEVRATVRHEGQRFHSAPMTVREVAVQFLREHGHAKTLKLDRAVVTAAPHNQETLDELRAFLWASSEPHRKVIHGVGHTQTEVVDGVPYVDVKSLEKVRYALNDVAVNSTPFVESRDVERGIERHVRTREYADEGSPRVSLWCNTGTAGSGKSTLLEHSAAAAVLELEEMVRAAVGDDNGAALWRHRPLGFVVTFNTHVTSNGVDYDFGGSFLLTRIAMRMLFSLAGSAKPCGPDSAAPLTTQDFKCSFSLFVKAFRTCALRGDDRENFTDIVSAIREVANWEGPLFLAVDEFAMPFHQVDDYDRRELTTALTCLCQHVLDDARQLHKNADGTLSWAPHDVLCSMPCEGYCVVSVYRGLDPSGVATGSRRKLIAQPMPSISVVDLLKRYARMSDAALKKLGLPATYSQILKAEVRRRGLSIDQHLFLVEVALTRGHPRDAYGVIAGYSRDWGRRFALLSTHGTSTFDVGVSTRIVSLPSRCWPRGR